MEYVSMIFMSLCVTLYSGGEDCSYLWTQTPRTQLMDMYHAEGGKASFVVAFTTNVNKKVFFGPDVGFGTINHEIKHVVCQLEYEKAGINHPNCTGHFFVGGQI